MRNLHDAAFQEHAIAQWRDWRRFLTLNLQLIDLRAAPAGEIAFELGDSSAEREHAIKAQLAAIPADVRALFGRMLEDRRSQVQATLAAERRAAGDPRGQPLDADEVERTALAALLDEAQGLATQGIGQVPMADGWYDVDAAQLGDVPDESRYQLAGARRLPLQRVVMIAVVLLAGGLAIWLTRPVRALPAGAAAAEVLVNDQPITPWQPYTLDLIGAHHVTLPVLAAEAAAAGERAGWQPGAWPLTLCAPPEALAGATSARVGGSGDMPVRSYTITDSVLAAADLIIEPCSGAGTPRYGLFQSAGPLVPQALGAAGRLSDGRSLTLRTLTTIGPAQDPTLPPATMQVVAVADTPAQFDWAHLSAALRWPDGSDILPTDTSVDAATATFRYLAPLAAQPLEAVQWRVSDPSGGALLAWQAPLAPPPTRAQLLAGALADVQVQAVRAGPDSIRLTLAIENGSPGQLALSAADIGATLAGRRLEIAPIEALRTPLAAHESRSVELVLALPAHQTLVLTLGSFAFEITA